LSSRTATIVLLYNYKTVWVSLFMYVKIFHQFHRSKEISYLYK